MFRSSRKQHSRRPLAGSFLLPTLFLMSGDVAIARDSVEQTIEFSAADAELVVRTEPYIENALGDCAAGDSCVVYFGAIGSEKRLNIDSVSCFIRVADDGLLLYTAVQSDENQFDVLVPKKIGADADDTNYALNHKTRFTVGPGAEFWIDVIAVEQDVIESAVCKVAGELATLK